jgi:hypothetical protein
LKPTPEQLARLEQLVRRADPAWGNPARDVPLLLLPSEVFAWEVTNVYFANTGVAASRELYVEICGFDAPARKTMDPAEIDWCIPLDYPGATELQRLGWRVGWGEGWSDSRPVVQLRFGDDYRAFFQKVHAVGKIAVAEVGRDTASLLVQLERNLRDIAAFAGPAAVPS